MLVLDDRYGWDVDTRQRRAQVSSGAGENSAVTSQSAEPLLPGFIVDAQPLSACLLWNIKLGAATIDRHTVVTALL